jgi:hypothetical protein
LTGRTNSFSCIGVSARAGFQKNIHRCAELLLFRFRRLVPSSGSAAPPEARLARPSLRQPAPGNSALLVLFMADLEPGPPGTRD